MIVNVTPYNHLFCKSDVGPSFESGCTVLLLLSISRSTQNIYYLFWIFPCLYFVVVVILDVV